ncbi:hypothetical protein MRB53_039908 [Persea americana]|nr:hypothetical protein MRB53_039908 [Persea americana]
MGRAGNRKSIQIRTKKAVFVYRFIAGGTFEEKLENNQIFKKGLASRVIDKKDTIRQARRSIEDWLHDPREVRAEPVYEWIGKDPGVLDTILEAQRLKDISDGAGMNHIFKIRTMETLHAESDDADLDEAEKQEVAVEIEASKTKRRESARLIAQRSTQMPPAALTPRKSAAFRDALTRDGQSSKPLTPSSLSKSVLPPSTSTSASASKAPARPLSTASTTDRTAPAPSQSTQRPSEQGSTTTVPPTAKPSAQPTSTANVAPALPSQSAQRSSTQTAAKSMPSPALSISVPKASSQRAPMTPSKLSSVVSSQEPQQTPAQTQAGSAASAQQKDASKSVPPAIQADDTPPLSTDEPMTQAAAERLLGGLSNCRMAKIFLANKLLLRRNVLALRTILEENVASRDDPDEFWRLYQHQRNESDDGTLPCFQRRSCEMTRYEERHVL